MNSPQMEDNDARGSNNNGRKKEECNTSIMGQQSSNKRKRKEVAIFGNYRNYYGYRIGQEMEEDPRLKVMKKEWFQGKDCLDIGCNSGLITIAIAKKFRCRSILGVDIDGDRIEDAYKNLRKIWKSTGRKQLNTLNLADSEVNSSDNCSNEAPIEDKMQNFRDPSPSEGRDMSDIISFEKGNFIRNWLPADQKSYDTVTCLSVTKWIHLNWGDDGLITLFSKVWRLLRPGGIFIVEPQPWISYYKNRLVSETARNNYQNIKIQPEDIQHILLDKIGFRTVENITSSLGGTKTGFGRPILALWK